MKYLVILLLSSIIMLSGCTTTVNSEPITATGIITEITSHGTFQTHYWQEYEYGYYFDQTESEYRCDWHFVTYSSQYEVRTTTFHLDATTTVITANNTVLTNQTWLCVVVCSAEYSEISHDKTYVTALPFQVSDIVTVIGNLYFTDNKVDINSINDITVVNN